MTLPTFPTLPGLGFPKRSSIWSTVKQPAIGGQESRFAQWSYPRWAYDYPFELLRAYGSFAELQALEGFYNRMNGSAGMFQFHYPPDSSVVAQEIGLGDGATTQFQLLRARGGFVEPVFAPVDVALYRQDWQGTVLLSPDARTNAISPSMPSTANFWSVTLNDALAPYAATAPDGSGTVGKFTEGAGTTGHQIIPSGMPAILTSGGAVTLSIWCAPGPAGAHRYLAAVMLDSSGNIVCGAIFDPATGVVTFANTAPGITVAATATASPNGFHRFSVTFTPIAAGSQSFAWRCTAAPTDLTGAQSGDSASGVLLFGGQLEAAAAVGSYIPTTGGAPTAIDYSLGPTGVVTLATPPLAGANLTWTGSFNWLCQFDDDQIDFQQFDAGRWSMDSLKFSTVKL